MYYFLLTNQYDTIRYALKAWCWARGIFVFLCVFKVFRSCFMGILRWPPQKWNIHFIYYLRLPVFVVFFFVFWQITRFFRPLLCFETQQSVSSENLSKNTPPSEVRILGRGFLQRWDCTAWELQGPPGNICSQIEEKQLLLKSVLVSLAFLHILSGSARRGFVFTFVAL